MNKKTREQNKENETIVSILTKLGDYYIENVRPHKEMLYLVGYSMGTSDHFEVWKDNIAESMANALEKLMVDAANALQALEETLDIIRDAERAKEPEVDPFYKSIFEGIAKMGDEEKKKLEAFFKQLFSKEGGAA